MTDVQVSTFFMTMKKRDDKIANYCEVTSLATNSRRSYKPSPCVTIDEEVVVFLITLLKYTESCNSSAVFHNSI